MLQNSLLQQSVHKRTHFLDLHNISRVTVLVVKVISRKIYALQGTLAENIDALAVRIQAYLTNNQSKFCVYPVNES